MLALTEPPALTVPAQHPLGHSPWSRPPVQHHSHQFLIGHSRFSPQLSRAIGPAQQGSSCFDESAPRLQLLVICTQRCSVTLFVPTVIQSTNYICLQHYHAPLMSFSYSKRLVVAVCQDWTNFTENMFTLQIAINSNLLQSLFHIGGHLGAFHLIYIQQSTAGIRTCGLLYL